MFCVTNVSFCTEVVISEFVDEDLVATIIRIEEEKSTNELNTANKHFAFIYERPDTKMEDLGSSSRHHQLTLRRRRLEEEGEDLPSVLRGASSTRYITLEHTLSVLQAANCTDIRFP